MESFEELELGVGLLGDDARWLQEGMSVHVQRYENEPIAVTLPTRVSFASRGGERAGRELGGVRAGEGGEVYLRRCRRSERTTMR
tara:strand:- start:387 stop:641 length:255 start_codon:yes stop_codon:yes gene_type:complete